MLTCMPTSYVQITYITNPFNWTKQAQLCSTIIQQLKDLKTLEETGVLDKEEFQAQKNKLVHELSSL